MNKYLFLGTLAFLFASITMGQEIRPEQVSPQVISAFQNKFPIARDIEWEMDNADFEVDFKIGKTEWSAKYDPTGKLLETEREIKVSELPSNVRKSIESEYPSFKIKEAEQLTLADNTIFYEVEVKRNKKTYEVQTTSDGKILKRSEEKETDKE